jgi:Fe2+ transport system protein B
MSRFEGEFKTKITKECNKYIINREFNKINERINECVSEKQIEEENKSKYRKRAIISCVAILIFVVLVFIMLLVIKNEVATYIMGGFAFASAIFWTYYLYMWSHCFTMIRYIDIKSEIYKDCKEKNKSYFT